MVLHRNRAGLARPAVNDHTLADSRVQVSGSYFISTTKLQQPGNFVRGVWFPTSDPVVGKVSRLTGGTGIRDGERNKTVL